MAASAPGDAGTAWLGALSPRRSSAAPGLASPSRACPRTSFLAPLGHPLPPHARSQLHFYFRKVQVTPGLLPGQPRAAVGERAWGWPWGTQRLRAPRGTAGAQPRWGAWPWAPPQIRAQGAGDAARQGQAEGFKSRPTASQNTRGMQGPAASTPVHPVRGARSKAPCSRSATAKTVPKSREEEE